LYEHTVPTTWQYPQVTKGMSSVAVLETRLNGQGHLPDRHWGCAVEGVW
jgi:hypothetical protein